MTQTIQNARPPAKPNAHLGRLRTRRRRRPQTRLACPLRKAAIARFSELGFPTTNDEDWRFTNVAPIAALPFKPVLTYSANGVNAAAVAKNSFTGLKASRLVFVNGHFRPRTFLDSARGRTASKSAASPPRCNTIPPSSKNISPGTRMAADNAFHRAQHRFLPRRRVHLCSVGRHRRRARSICCLSPPQPNPARPSIRAISSSRKKTASSRSSRVTSAHADAAYFTNAVEELIIRRERRRRALQIPGRKRGGVSHRRHSRAPGPQLQFHRPFHRHRRDAFPATTSAPAWPTRAWNASSTAFTSRATSNSPTIT